MKLPAGFDEESVSFSVFARSIANALIEGLGRNKLPALLAGGTLVVTTTLAVTAEYHEQPRYRQLFMPDFTKAESRFIAAMNAAEKATDADWKAHYFVDAHRGVTSLLYLARTYHPRTAGGRRAQRELVRYYELVDEELAIIRTKMSLDESYDYIDEWKEWNGQAMRIRQRWADWVNGN